MLQRGGTYKLSKQIKDIEDLGMLDLSNGISYLSYQLQIIEIGVI